MDPNPSLPPLGGTGRGKTRSGAARPINRVAGRESARRGDVACWPRRIVCTTTRNGANILARGLQGGADGTYAPPASRSRHLPSSGTNWSPLTQTKPLLASICS